MLSVNSARSVSSLSRSRAAVSALRTRCSVKSVSVFAPVLSSASKTAFIRSCRCYRSSFSAQPRMASRYTRVRSENWSQRTNLVPSTCQVKPLCAAVPVSLLSMIS